MTRNVVKLETAKKLKAAGFPQSTQQWHQSGGIVGPFKSSTSTLEMLADSRQSTTCAAPTAQEIADQLSPFSVVRLSDNTDQAQEYQQQTTTGFHKADTSGRWVFRVDAITS